MKQELWTKNWSVGVRVWIERQGKSVLGQGRAELLEAIGTRNSITAAAKAAGISYRRAWTMIQEINRAAGEPLVKAAVGGTKGGGAILTERGQFALKVYRRLEQGLHERAAGVLAHSLRPAIAASEYLHVSAAISLQELVGQILSIYALRRPSVAVRAIYGASNELAEHLLNGAPGDLFIAAEKSIIDRLEDAEKILPRSRRIVATNGLTVIGPRGKSSVRKSADLASPQVRKIVLADPQCPLGKYSQQYLQAAGIYDRIFAKVIHVDNSRAVLSAIAAKAADIGLAFSSDATRSDQCQVLFDVPSAQALAEYVAVVTRSSRRQKEAQQLLDFISSPDQTTLFARCGFKQSGR